MVGEPSGPSRVAVWLYMSSLLSRSVLLTYLVYVGADPKCAEANRRLGTRRLEGQP